MRNSARLVLVIFSLCVFGVWTAGFSAHAAVTADQRKEVALRYYRGVVNFEAGRYDVALIEFQAVAIVDPYYKDVQQYLEKCVRSLDDTRQGLFKANESDPTVKRELDLYFLGRSYYEKGDIKRAHEVFKSVLARTPNDKYALYYAKLCEDVLSGTREAKKARMSPEEAAVLRASDLEKEVAYVKSDIKEQENVELFLEKKAERKAARDELIRKKERQLEEQEELLEEERQDYLAQEKIAKRTQKIKKEAEKWKNMKERLSSDQPGLPAEMIEYPVCVDKAERYYVAMKEALRTSRWNAAGLNAIGSTINFCDAVLIYFYSIRSAEPRHENMARLLLTHMKRADTEANVSRLHSILNLKKIIESEDRPITRNEAIFLSEHAEKLAEWCKTVLP